MRNRLILLIASAGSALVLTAGLAAAGFGPAPAADSQADMNSVDAVATADIPVDAPTATERVVTDTVYLTPQATPEVIVTKVVQPRATSNPGSGTTAQRDNGGENEAGDD